MINETVSLPNIFKNILSEENILFYPQIGLPYEKKINYENVYLINDSSFLIPLGNEYHHDLEPRKHFLFINGKLIIQFYTFFERTNVSNKEDFLKIITWHVFIQKIIKNEDCKTDEEIKELIVDAANKLKDLTGLELENILEIKVKFREK
ncbi:hypothetical protein [Acinetobacter sp. ANC 3832]|uniref:hypothetical protein n=1 Tax=Acinetobacter sp. ANC 3832 TaxID=1977874 RepID=UPI000A356E5E|nr:hypothetical protein [Acinetobacter sp. ANC 3832]OTG93881.1 hypothetical protein B9T35_09295 [Acinetobacter sp. ANC 3832]